MTATGLRPAFRTKLFLTSLSAAVVALAVAGVLFATVIERRTNARIEATLVSEARVLSELLAGRPLPSEPAELNTEAHRLGEVLGARITLIGADGRVVGDSAESLDGLATMENHATRPEVVDARRDGIGLSRRYSATVRIDMLYVAAPVRLPTIAFVRLALPLTDVRQQLQAVLWATLTALVVALAAAGSLAWWMSGRLGRRVRTIADVARRYAGGDLQRPAIDYGSDELGTVATVLDESVHELGARMRELARDRARMEAILAGMVEGVIVVDPEGRLQLANGAARRMLKLEETLGLGRHYVETIRHPVIVDLLATALGGEATGMLQLSPPRDASRTITARAAPAHSGVAYGAVLVLHDITDLKRADQIRRDFVANVSHELRTPLTAIRGYVEALSEEDTTADEHRSFLEIITRHTLRMERLVKDLLRLARLDAGQEPLEIAPCETRAIVDAVAVEMQLALEERDQRIDVRIASDASTLHGDPAKLHDALRNLVANAVIYAPEHTTITVEAIRTGTAVTVSVSDQGPGIPEEDLDRVFERFYRVDKSRARDAGGTGLGLAIVKHLVGLHGGEVKVENRKEGGARFTMTLPDRAEPA